MHVQARIWFGAGVMQLPGQGSAAQGVSGSSPVEKGGGLLTSGILYLGPPSALLGKRVIIWLPGPLQPMIISEANPSKQ